MLSQRLRLACVVSAGLIGVMFATSATASMNYRYSDGYHDGSYGSDNYVYNHDGSGGSGDYDVKVTAWSDTGYRGKLESGGYKSWGDGVSVYHSGESCSSWGGFSCGSQYIDNANHNDMMLFDYGDKMFSMKSVDFDHYGDKDSDITVMAYVGAKGGHGLEGKTYGELGDGWKVVGHYSDNDGDGKITFNDDCETSSSYWLVGAFNAKVGHHDGWRDKDGYSDYVKFKGGHGCFKTHDKPGCEPGDGNGNGGTVPEPATLALLGFGLLGMTLVRRRNSGDQLSC